MIYAFGECELDTKLYELRRGGVREPVEPQVFDVLAYLLAHRDRVVGRDELLAQVWGHQYVSDATLNSRLKAARRAIGDDGRAQALIRTVRGRGYRFVGPVDRVAAVEEPAPTAAAPPVGREAERLQLAGLLADARGGARRLAIVTGEAGVGKTTLVESFVAEAGAREPLLAASGRCVEQAGPVEPYMALLEALGRLSRGPGGARVVETLSALAPTWLAQLDAAAADGLDIAPGYSGGPRPERMLREMAAALQALSRDSPLLLVLDDLQWSDPSTLALLLHLARGDEPARLLVLATSRAPGDEAVRELIRELRPRGRCVEIALRRLGRSAVREYVDDRHPGLEAPDELVEVLHRRADGNPLFMECLLAWWIERGALEAEGGRWRLRGAREALARDVPESVRDLIEHDVLRLGDEDAAIVEAASVAGAVFSCAAPAAAVGRPLEHVEERCERLARRGRLLRRHGEEEWPDGTVATTFAFVHDLHRQVVYERIPAGRRTRIHRDIGARLEAGYATRAGACAPELARHFLAARQPERALHYLRLAAEQARSRGAPRESVSDLQAALDLVERSPALPDRDGHMLALQSSLAGALVATEGWASEAAERAYRRALELAGNRGDARSQATLLYELAGIQEYRGRYRSSEALLTEALRLERAADDTPRLVEAHELMACSLFHQGSFQAAVEHADRGLSLHEPDRPHPGLAFHGEDPAVACNDWAGLSLWCLGHFALAENRIRSALELARAPGYEHSLATAWGHSARLRQLRREPAEAGAHAKRALALARTGGFAYQAAVAEILLGWALAVQGDGERGIARVRAGLAAHRATGAMMDRPYFLALLAEALVEAGRPREALAAIGEAAPLIEEERSFFYEPELHRLRGVLTHSLREADAERSIRRALELARRRGARALELRAAVTLTRLFDGAEARAALAGALEWFGADAEAPDIAEARELLAR